MSWAYLRHFPPLVWIVILGTFMVRTTFFMVWPFLSILLYRDYGLSATLIGLILGSTAALSTLVSFYGGWLSDKWGRRNILLFGCLVSALSVSLLGLSHQVFWLAIGVVGSGLSYGLIDSPGKALMADSLAEPKARELALHLRYFLLNLGAAIGPLLGVSYGLSARQETFLLLSASYLLLGLIFILGFRLAGAQAGSAAGPGMRAVLRVLWQDRGFLLLTLANVLLMLVYAQFESPLIQYLTRAGTPEVERLIGWLVSANALTIVILQFPLLHLTANWLIKSRLQLGVAIFLGAQVLFALGDTAIWWHWIVAVILLSVGECILFPLLNVLIDQMAPSHLKGSYFGAASMSGLGIAIGALLGGWILTNWGGSWLYGLMALLCLAILVLYGWGTRIPRPTLIQVSTEY
ncbi:MFS transporter [Aeromonas sp. MR16]|uniref:MDR family MFS transporter n=1 Tax=Aeromonas sp. MR16 TaxID=2923420 RepID=UPI001F4AC1BB|nr:MFS transporter [Aeromonas sp. MR16]MCH7372728.1 MFS transporter [Aeromonas sp. MR16]